MKALISSVFQRFGASSRKAVLFLFPLLLLLAGGAAAVRVQGHLERFDPNLHNNAGAVPGTANAVPTKTVQSGGTTNTLRGPLGSATELWVSSYNGPANSSDDAGGVAVSQDGFRVFVTGVSGGVGTADDWATVAYDTATGNQLWVTRFNGPGNGNDAPQAPPVVSPDGSRIYVTGGMTIGNGNFVMRTVAYDAADGHEVWASSYQGPANMYDSPRALALSSDGSRLFVTGISEYPSPVFRKYATLAYDADDGSQLWVTEYNGPGTSDEAYAVAVSPDGSRVFVTGGSIGAGTHVDFGTVAYDATDGSELWVARYNGPGNNQDTGRALGLSVDGSRVFVTGESASGATVNSFDYATVAYDANDGSQLWVSRYNGPANGGDWARKLAVAGDRVFVTGGSPGMAAPLQDFATVAYDTADGHQLWVARYQGLDDQSPWHSITSAIGTSPDGTHMFVAGGSPGLGTNLDYVTAAYRTSDGQELWIARYDGEQGDDTATGLAMHGSRVYVTGSRGAGAALNNDFATVAYDEQGQPPPTPTATPPPPTPTPTPTPCGGSIIFSENFDGVIAPALPPGWVTCPPSGNGIQWVTSTILPDTAPNCLFIDDQAGISDKCVVAGQTPPFIVITSATAQLRFRNNFNTEYSPPPNQIFYDGGVLEISINGGAFKDVTDPAIGGSFVTGGYTGIIDEFGGNPLAARPAWSGNSGGYINTVVNLGAAVNGQTIRIRFRMGTDNMVGAPGWRVDTLSIADGSCATPTPTPTPTVTPSGTPSPNPTATPTPTPTPTLTPTPTPSATSTPTPSATATPSGTATPSATPTPGPAAQALNLSTRMRVQTGDNVGIGGFIIAGTASKHVLLRAIGPSLTQFGVPNALPDPVLELHGPGAFATITNNNWRDDPVQEALILATGLAPTNDLESSIDANLSPGAYTAVVRGNNNTTGVALIEVYDVSQAVPAKLANISTRAFVGTGDDIVIAGFILGSNGGNDRIVLRGIGPSLTALGVPNALANPMLELRDSNGALLIANNDWQDNPAQAAELTAAGLAPTNPLESGIAATLSPGAYTALLAGLNNVTGNGVVEVYDRGAP